MATTVQQIHPIAHLPLVLGVLRRLEVATVIDRLIPPHPAHGLSCGRGVEALVLAILDGHHALYKGEHSVILTFPVAAVGTVETPDPVCRYTSHTGAPTSDCCWFHTTTPPSASAAHDK